MEAKLEELEKELAKKNEHIFQLEKNNDDISAWMEEDHVELERLNSLLKNGQIQYVSVLDPQPALTAAKKVKDDQAQIDDLTEHINVLEENLQLAANFNQHLKDDHELKVQEKDREIHRLEAKIQEQFDETIIITKAFEYYEQKAQEQKKEMMTLHLHSNEKLDRMKENVNQLTEAMKMRDEEIINISNNFQQGLTIMNGALRQSDFLEGLVAAVVLHRC